MAVTIRVKRGTATQWAARTTPLLSGEFGYDLTNKITKIGDGTTLWASLPSIGSSGGTNTGDITFDGVQIIGAGTASGDGYGLGTIELVPDGNITSDQYLIIDPTAPNHIHIRAGGTQDASTADLFLGGERNNVLVSDNGRSVSVSTRPEQVVNTYVNANEISNTEFIVSNSANINLGDTLFFIEGGDTVTVNSITPNSPNAGLQTVTAELNGIPAQFTSGGTYIFTHEEPYNNSWIFDSDGYLYGPGEGVLLLVEGIYNSKSHLTLQAMGINNKVILDGQNGEFINDASDPENQIATLGDIADANSYTDLAIAGLSDTVDNGYIPIGQKATAGGVASLGLDGYIPDTQISPDIARDSEIITSYNDLTDKPNIALGAVKWTANHYLLPGGENTRYLAGDIVWDGGSIFVANFDNESLPTTNTQYWTNIGSGNRLNIDGRDIPNILWDNILDKPALFDGDYGNLTNKPSIPADVSDLTDTTNLLVPFDSPTFTGTVNVDNLEISGDLTFSGTATQINSTETTLSDPMIYLGEGNAADINDLGFVASFDNGTYQHAGLVRDASDHTWKLFKGVIDEPTNTVNFSQAILDDLAMGTLNATSASIGDVSNTELQYLNGVTSGIQEQLDAKLSTDAAAIIYLGKIEAGLTYAPKSSPTFTGTVTLPENTSGANLVNIPNSALSNSSITINGSAVSLGGSTTIDALPSQSGNDGKYLTTNGTLASWGTIDLSSKLDISEPSVDYYVTNAGAGSYVVNGVSNGTMYFEKGKKYRIHVNASGHPFWIQSVSGGYSSSNVYNTGITNNGTQNGHIIVELPQDAPQLYYACQFHSSMAGSIVTGITTVIPLQTDQSGKYLTTNGTTTSWAEVSGGGGTSGADIMNIMEAW